MNYSVGLFLWALLFSGQTTAAVPSFQVMDSLPKRDCDLAFLEKALPDAEIYSQNVLLKAPFRVMQSFDIDSRANIYYSQVGAVSGHVQGKTKSHELYILRGQANQSPQSDYMTLKYFGHGSNIAIEEENGEVYVWVNSNGSKNLATMEYEDSRSVSRIKYESGKVYENGYAGETYFLNNGIYNVHPALDIKNDMLAISATKRGTRYFYFYRLSEARKLPVEDFTVKLTIGGEETESEERIDTRQVKGYDLSKLTPISSFVLPKGTNKMKDVNSYSFQGFDVDGDYMVFYEGDGNKNNIENGPSNAYVTVFSLEGTVICERTKVNAIADIAKLNERGITQTGYMEAEGIKIKGNKIYLAFASRGFPLTEDGYRRANILQYDRGK